MADPYIRVRISGSLATEEVWSINPCFGGDFAPVVISHADLQNAADDIAALNTNKVLGSNMQALLSNAGNVSLVRVEWYTNGTTLTDVAETALSPVGAGTGSAKAPISTSVCVSLLTGLIGRRFRGRLFLPAPGLGVDPGTLKIPNGVATALADEVATWLVDVADALPSAYPWAPVVQSKTGAQTNVVTSVRVGNVPDNVRTRKTQLSETYVSSPVS